jgi:uncharacterized ferritin-like protein (DUF455 family)
MPSARRLVNGVVRRQRCPAMSAPSAPSEGTVERFAHDYVASTELAHKLAPGMPPTAWEDAPPSRRILSPGRPPSLVVTERAPKSPRAGALRDPRRRAQILHTFFHHELQAAELMAWALLAFPETPRAFRVGLLHVLADEVRHANMYAREIERLGSRIGDFPVRDWFWSRVPSARSAVEFCAVFGMGFEGANLDHAPRFAARFRDAGDEEGARVQDLVAEEEVPHVTFALRWFSRWTGGAEFSSWAACLPPPISPMLLRGDPIERKERLRAGFSEDFLDALSAWQKKPGS